VTRTVRISPLVIAATLVATLPTRAQENCRLDNPQVVREQGGAQLKVRITCQPARAPGTLRYPAGKLYLGVTLYSVEDPRLRGAVVPIVERSGHLTPTYVAPVEFTRPGASQALTLPLGDLGANTHILVAVWDKRNACSDPNSAACRVARATLGRTDSFGMPIPIDTWPRPVCDVERLTRNGFFNWVDTDGVIAPDVPDEVSIALQTNDCWMRQRDGLGLGYSVRQWRAQPLSRQ